MIAKSFSYLTYFIIVVQMLLTKFSWIGPVCTFLNRLKYEYTPLLNLPRKHNTKFVKLYVNRASIGLCCQETPEVCRISE